MDGLYDLPSEIIDEINDYGMIYYSTGEQLYNAIKRINPNYSLQMEYQARMLNQRRYSTKLTDKELLQMWNKVSDNTAAFEIYNLTKKLNYCIESIEDEDEEGDSITYYNIYSNALTITILRNIFYGFIGKPRNMVLSYGKGLSYLTYSDDVDVDVSDEEDEDSNSDEEDYNSDEDEEEDRDKKPQFNLELVMESLMRIIKNKEKGIIYRDKNGYFVFKLNVPEVAYFDTYSDNLVKYMEEDGFKLLDIALQQQENYILTKNINNDVREYIDKNRFIIDSVRFKDQSIFIDIINSKEIYEIKGDMLIFKSIVAYLYHPMNIIYENMIDKNIAYKYYTLDTL